MHNLDISIPTIQYGTSHPITQAIDEIKQIMEHIGFTFAAAPEVDTTYYNFTALNIPEHHPARSMHDTFYLEDDRILRTHTSNIQARIKSFPCRVASIGKVYRSDCDATHSPMFHQLECFVVEDKVNIQHMKWTIDYLLGRFFKQAEVITRFRSSYFPFTTPSYEVDIFWNNDWLEVIGCGIIHQAVINKNGFAFGIGIERIIMIRDSIHDVRFFYEPDQRWLNGVKIYEA